MAKRTVGRARFYADLGSYLKLKSFYASDKDGIENDNVDSVWNLDPSASETFRIDFESSKFSFWQRFSDDENNTELKRLLFDSVPESSKTGLYAGVLGYNPNNLVDNSFNALNGLKFGFTNQAKDIESYQDEVTEIINYSNGLPQYNGYSLWEIDSFTEYELTDNFDRFGMSFEAADNFGLIDGENKTIDCGSITFGRFFEPEHSFDLQATIMKDNDGIKRNRTVGGNTLINVNYLGSESWGDLPAWTLGKQAGVDYKPVSHSGRRTWKVSLSYIQDENMFNKHNNENQFFTYDTDDNLHTFDTSLGSFFGLTFDGQIPFLFCPDKDADNLEFAKCVITNKPTFKQVANNLFSTSLVLTEVF